jgi:hypothetical protein
MTETHVHDSGTGTGMILGVLLVIVAIIALMLFGGANFFRGGGTTNTSTGVQVPEKVDVNVNSGQ